MNNLNPYSIILALFILTGIITTARGAYILAVHRRRRNWPSTDGFITESSMKSGEGDLLPDIRFCYTVNDRTYQQTLRFTDDISPSEEFGNSYVLKYPPDSRVRVHYNPDNPADSVLDPADSKGDWLLLSLGLGMSLLGIIALVAGL